MDQFSFFSMLPVEPALYAKKAIFFPLDGFSSFEKYQVTTGVWVHFWDFNSIPLIYVATLVTCVSLYLYHAVFITIVELLEVQDTDFP